MIREERSGRLHRVHRGVYAVGHTNLSLHGQCLAAVFAVGPGSLLSHYSAAWLWDLGIRNPRPFHVTGPGPRRYRPPPPIRIHRARNLTPRDRALVEGIPVTSVARTSLDLAAAIRPRRLTRLLEREEELRLFDLEEVESVIDRNRGHHGSRRLRKATALYQPPPFSRSGLERHFLDLAAEAGLPRPATGYNELGYELDVYWPEHRFAVELDTFETHGSRLSFHEDRRRHEDLTLAGIAMVRITDERLAEAPTEVIERIRAELHRREATEPVAQSSRS